MAHVKSLVICALLGAALLPAQTKWTYMQSPNFQVYSGAGERETRATLQYFEQVRDFFLLLNKREPANPVPVYIVIFKSEKEYIPYRFNEFAIAYYTGRTERDYIVLGTGGDSTAHIATHEYVHLVMRHAGLNLPPWMNEGLAELYSTLNVVGNSIQFGDVIPGRMQALYTDKWVPLKDILEADSKSPYYNESNKAGNLYNQSWALVHMLTTTNDYRGKFSDVVDLVNSGTGSVQALEKTYGMPVAKLEAELKGYIRGNLFHKLVMKGRLDASKMKVTAEPANMFDVNFSLADLSNRQGKEKEVRSRLEELTRDDPKRPEPWVSLAYLTWRDGNIEETVGHFGKAYELGSRGPKFLQDYARLAAGVKPEESIRAYGDLLSSAPENVDARIELAGVHARARDWIKTLQTLSLVKKVNSEQAPRVFQLLGTAQLQLGQQDQARASAQRLADTAKTEQQRTEAQRMIQYLDQVKQRAELIASAQRSIPVEPELAPRRFERAAPQAPKEEPAEIARPLTPTEQAIRESILHDVEAPFVELSCNGGRATMILQTKEGRKSFAILDPNKIIVTGSDSGFADMDCGRQAKPVTIHLQYTDPPEGLQASGVVRKVEFPKK
jgi:tetratricopeptide (TPR) repeat protein